MNICYQDIHLTYLSNTHNHYFPTSIHHWSVGTAFDTPIVDVHLSKYNLCLTDQIMLVQEVMIRIRTQFFLSVLDSIIQINDMFYGRFKR